jgi:hypothetical protein
MTNRPNEVEVADKATVDRAVMEFQDAAYANCPEGWRPDSVEAFEVREEQERKFNQEEWEAKGTELAQSDTEVRWKIGEWLLEGEPHLPYIPPERIAGHMVEYPPDVYSIAEFITGLSRITLKDLASTANRCPASVRTDELSWSHHRVLINNRPNATKEQLKDWLRQAVDKRLSVAKFKELTNPKQKPPTDVKSFVVTVPLDVWETLKVIADEEDSSVPEVAAEWLSNVDEELGTKIKRKMAEQSTAKRRKERRRQVGKRVARTYDPVGLQRER